MALVNKTEKMTIDTSVIKEGDLIYVEYENWDEPKSGIVLFVSEDRVTFLYHPQIANVTNLHTLNAAEIAEGGYKIKWSTDMSTVNEYEPEGDE